MRLSRRARFTNVIAGAIVLVAAASGITYATTAASTLTNDYAVGCSSTHHALRLINSDGSCPTGYTRINVAAAPISLDVASTATTGTTKTVSIPGFSLTASCAADGFSKFDIDTTASGPTYDVQGSELYENSGQDGSLLITSNNSSGVYEEGPSVISYEQDPGNGKSGFQLGAGAVSANVIVIHTGHSFTVNIALFQYPGSCSVQAQISQSS